MKYDDPESSAILFDFVDQYLEDADSGSILPLERYLPRFPGHEEEIRRRYLELAELRSRASAENVPSTPLRIGPYRIVRELGRGGQGAVFLAEDTRGAGTFALKALSSPLGNVSEKRRRRLRREAEVIARLDHPGICSIHDVELEGSTPYIAMRFVEGTTLASLLDRARARVSERVADGSSPTPAACDATETARIETMLVLLEKVARALHAAHEAGVVHRDIKPANLLVMPDGSPVILDFGLARDEDALESALTQTGEVFGTFAYMAPEQLATPAVTIDRRVDVFALGVTLYEVLTLERPFPGRASTSGPREEPRRPSALCPSITRELDAVCQRAMAGDRDERYATAEELARDLENVRLSRPTRARPVTAGARIVRRARRNPWTSGLLLIGVAASVCAFVFFASWRAESAQREAASAFMRWRDGDPRPDDWRVIERYLPALDEEARRVMLENPRSREARDLFIARLSSGLRGSEGSVFHLCSPRARVAETRPSFLVTTDLDRNRAWDLVATIELPGSDLTPITRRVEQPAGSSSVRFDLPPDLALQPGEWRWSVALADADASSSTRAGSEVFEVVPASRVGEILGAVVPTGDVVLDRHLRALALLREDLGVAALHELAQSPASASTADSMRQEQLVAWAGAKAGDPSDVRAAYERWLALSKQAGK